MKGVILTTDQVRGILAGTVTAFRVPLKPQPPECMYLECHSDGPKDFGAYFFAGWNCSISDSRFVALPFRSGDILYVREAWRDRWGMAYANYGTGDAYPIDDVREIDYMAGGNGFFRRSCSLCPDEPTVKWNEWSKWCSPATMPRDAARLFLRVTDVTVERVQEITEEDAKREGVNGEKSSTIIPSRSFDGPRIVESLSYVWGYEKWWDARYGKRYPYESNPWTVGVTFERCKGEGK
jgi:hypothetical protein